MMLTSSAKLNNHLLNLFLKKELLFMNEKLHKYILSWIEKANHDLKCVALILNSNDIDLPLDVACFHCQQSAVKLIKAYLVYSDVEFPHTHNLADLIDFCIQKDETFTDYQKKLENLTPFAVEIRYPDYSYYPTINDAQESYQLVLDFKKFIKNKMKDLFEFKYFGLISFYISRYIIFNRKDLLI